MDDVRLDLPLSSGTAITLSGLPVVGSLPTYSRVALQRNRPSGALHHHDKSDCGSLWLRPRVAVANSVNPINP